MARPQKYDWAKIEIDYKAGLSQAELHKKYEVPYNLLSERAKKWEQNEQAKAVIKGFDEVSEVVTELKRTNPELVQPVLDIVTQKHPEFKKAMIALSGKLFNRMLKIADEATANEIPQLAKGMQTITDTLGISQRHASNQVNVQTNTNMAPQVIERRIVDAKNPHN